MKPAGDICSFAVLDPCLFVLPGFGRSTGSCRPAGKTLTRVTSTNCGLSGHREYASPQWTTSGKQGRKPSNQGAEEPEFVAAVKKNGAPKASRKAVVSIDQHPAVALCDISQNLDAFSQDCGYALPDVLKTKVVRCFRREMRAGFRFEPGLFGRNKNERNEESSLAESRRICTPVPSQGLAPDRQAPVQEHPRVLSGRGADPLFNSWMRCKCAKQKGSRTATLEGSEDPEPKGVESLSNRNRKLVRKPSVKINTSALDDGWSESGSSVAPSSVEENGVCGKSCDRLCTPTTSDASGTSPEVVCQNNEAGADDTTETCQRARAYFRKTIFSCARTDMPWPLISSGLTRTSQAATPACPALPADPSDTVNSPISTNQDAQSGCSSETLFSAPEGPTAGPTQRITHQNDEGRDGFLTGGNGEQHGNISSHSPDSTNVGFVLSPNSLQAERQPSPPSDGQRLRERASSADINSPGTPPSPSAVILSDMERTCSLYSISPPSSCQPSKVTSISLAGLSSPFSMMEPIENHLFFSEDARMISCSSSSSDSSLLLPQDNRDFDEETLSCPPVPLPHYERGTTGDEDNAVHYLLYKTCGEPDDALPTMLSPVTSPHRSPWRSLLSWSPGSSCRMEHEEEDTDGHKSPQLVNGNSRDSGVDQGSGEVLKTAPATEPQCSPSNQDGAERSVPSTNASDALDEVTAFKRDILLVDVTQDDAELFENLPQTSLLKLGPVRVSVQLKYKPLRTAKKQQLNSVELVQR